MASARSETILILVLIFSAYGLVKHACATVWERLVFFKLSLYVRARIFGHIVMIPKSTQQDLDANLYRRGTFDAQYANLSVLSAFLYCGGAFAAQYAGLSVLGRGCLRKITLTKSC